MFEELEELARVAGSNLLGLSVSVIKVRFLVPFYDIAYMKGTQLYFDMPSRL